MSAASGILSRSGRGRSYAARTVSRALAAYALVGLLMALATLAVYSRVLHAPFVFDDDLITSSQATQIAAPSDALALLTSGLPRKLTRATFALNFYAGWLDPFGYHAVNLALHALNGLLLFMLAGALIHCLPEGHPWRRQATTIALAGSVIWLVHPVQTQAVSYVWQRSTSLCAFFYLATVALYVGARRETGWRRWGLAAAAAGTSLAALTSKENAGSLPGALALIEIVFLRSAPQPAVRRSPPRRWWWAAALGAVSLLIAFDYLGPRFVSMMAADFTRRGFTLTERLLTEARVVVHYATLLLVPYPGRLTLDYDIQLSRSLLSPPSTGLSVTLICAATLWAAAALRRRSLAAFATLWFLGLLVIESTVVPLDLAYEHRLYLPSAVPIVFAAGAILGDRRPARVWEMRAAALVSIMAVFAVWSWQRNEVWRDPVCLFTDTAAKSPGKARVHTNLGNALRQAGDARGALAAYERAIALDPVSLKALTAQASLCMDELGDRQRAQDLLQRAIRLAPAYAPARNNLGVLYMREGRLDEAAAVFSALLDRDSLDPVAAYNLAAVHMNRRDYGPAERLLSDGLAAWPGNQKMRALLGLVFVARGDLVGAERAVAPAVPRTPRDPMLTAVLEEIVKRKQATGNGGQG